MKLIFLYGAPASGKFTVAKLLADRLGYKLFHNHVSIDVAKIIFEFGQPGFFDLSDNIRVAVFEEAAKQNVSGIVFTFVYKQDEANDKLVRRFIDAIEKYNGEIQFIQIYCDKKVLAKRVSSEQRKEMRKLVSPEELQKIMEGAEFQAEIPNVSSIKIDNTNLSIEETVDKVLEAINK